MKTFYSVNLIAIVFLHLIFCTSTVLFGDEIKVFANTKEIYPDELVFIKTNRKDVFPDVYWVAKNKISREKMNMEFFPLNSFIREKDGEYWYFGSAPYINMNDKVEIVFNVANSEKELFRTKLKTDLPKDEFKKFKTSRMILYLTRILERDSLDMREDDIEIFREVSNSTHATYKMYCTYILACYDKSATYGEYDDNAPHGLYKKYYEPLDNSIKYFHGIAPLSLSAMIKLIEVKILEGELDNASKIAISLKNNTDSKAMAEYGNAFFEEFNELKKEK